MQVKAQKNSRPTSKLIWMTHEPETRIRNQRSSRATGASCRKYEALMTLCRRHQFHCDAGFIGPDERWRWRWRHARPMIRRRTQRAADRFTKPRDDCYSLAPAGRKTIRRMLHNKLLPYMSTCSWNKNTAFACKHDHSATAITNRSLDLLDYQLPW